jgi:hypothetical protein
LIETVGKIAEEYHTDKDILALDQVIRFLELSYVYEYDYTELVNEFDEIDTEDQAQEINQLWTRRLRGRLKESSSDKFDFFTREFYKNLEPGSADS